MADVLKALSVVAVVLDDVPGERSRRGQVGPVVEELD
jgi:hypothetical protein